MGNNYISNGETQRDSDEQKVQSEQQLWARSPATQCVLLPKKQYQKPYYRHFRVSGEEISPQSQVHEFNQN